jgi:predicted Zn-dependent protease
MRTSFAILVFSLAAAVPLLHGCSSTTGAGTVGADRRQLLLVSADELNRSAAQQYAQLTQKAAQQGALDQDAAETARVRRIAARLIPQTGVFRPDAKGWAWEVHTLSSKEVNAWCMPGGKIAVYTGLIDRLKPTDDELAAVMGHEIAHALREHARERVSQQLASSAVVGIGAAALGLGQAGADIGNALATVTFGLPFSREHEREADRIGVELAARAGYDPRAAVTLWQKMASVSVGGGFELLSTHPAPESRIADLKVYAEKVMPLYEQARKAAAPAKPRSSLAAGQRGRQGAPGRVGIIRGPLARR